MLRSRHGSCWSRTYPSKPWISFLATAAVLGCIPGRLAAEGEDFDIEKLDDDSRIQDALMALGVGPPSARGRALWSLVEKDVAGDLVGPFTQWLGEHPPPEELRPSCAFAAVRLKARPAVPRMMHWLAEARDDFTRETLIAALGELRDPQARTVLEPLVQDPSDWVRFLAREAVQKLDGNWKPGMPSWPGRRGLRLAVVSRTVWEPEEYAFWNRLAESLGGGFTGQGLKPLQHDELPAGLLGGGLDEAIARFDFGPEGRPLHDLCVFTGLRINEVEPFFLWRLHHYVRRGGRVLFNGDDLFYHRVHRDVQVVDASTPAVRGRLIADYPWPNGPWDDALPERVERHPQFPAIDGLPPDCKAVWLGYRGFESGGVLVAAKTEIPLAEIIRKDAGAAGGEKRIPLEARIRDGSPVGNSAAWETLIGWLFDGPSWRPATLDWTDEPGTLSGRRAGSELPLNLRITWHTHEGGVEARASLSETSGPIVAQKSETLTGQPGESKNVQLSLAFPALIGSVNYRLQFDLADAQGRILHSFARSFTVLGRYDIGLRLSGLPSTLPAGRQRLPVTVSVTRFEDKAAGTPAPAEALFLVNEFADDIGRVLSRDRQSLRQDGPVKAELELPDLPAGQYFLETTVRDARGRLAGPPLPLAQDVLAVARGWDGAASISLPEGSFRTPVSRMERFEYDRDLLWGTWLQNRFSDIEAEGAKAAGINVGERGDYRFRYRWFVDHAATSDTGLWGEEAGEHPHFQWYREWTRWARDDPGFISMDFTDELPSRFKEGYRRNQLITWRLGRDWPGVSTLSAYNQKMQTDALSWDEVARPGFQGPSGPHAQNLEWAMSSYLNEFFQLRMDVVRAHNPFAQLTPGMGAGLLDNFYDSMHNRIYPHDSALRAQGMVLAGRPAYGSRPWTWLLQSLVPPFERFSHSAWAALAAAGRFFPVYCPGDYLGGVIVDTGGRLTPSGQMLKAVHDRIDPLKPVLLAARNRTDAEVLYWPPVWSPVSCGLTEGVYTCGVQPECNTDTANRKLIIALQMSWGENPAALRQAVEQGAGLLIAPTTPPAIAKAFGISQPANSKAEPQPAETFDLSSLQPEFPGLQGVRVAGEAGAAEADAGCPLQAFRSGGGTVAFAGPVGKGWVLALNVNLAYNRAGNGRLLRAVLDRAGVSEAFRFADADAPYHPGILGFLIETADRTQSYLIAVPGPDAPVKTRLYVKPEVRIVRDLCARRNATPVESPGGPFVDLAFEAGVGCLLSLVRDPDDAALAVTPSHPTLRGGENLLVEAARLGPRGQALTTSHTYRVRVRGPDGHEIPGLAAWNTGPSPVLLSLPVAWTDAPGQWTIGVEDLTDGSVASAEVLMKPPGERPPLPPLSASFSKTLTRGAANRGILLLRSDSDQPSALEGLSLRCLEPGVALNLEATQASLPAQGRVELPFTLEIEPSARARNALLTLRTGKELVGGIPVALPPPFRLELEPLPEFRGDLTLAVLRGHVLSSLAAPPKITIEARLPESCLLAGSNSFAVQPAAPFTPTPFAFSVMMPHGLAQALRGSRNEGVEVALKAEGFEPVRSAWKIPVNPYPRKPHAIGSLSGGKIDLLVENFTDRGREVTLSCEPCPGWAGGPFQVAAAVPAGKTEHFLHTVRWAQPDRLDPGFAWLPLSARIDGKTLDGGHVFIDQDMEQDWWVSVGLLQPGESDEELTDEVLSMTPQEAEKKGWKRVRIQSVLWWDELARQLLGEEAEKKTVPLLAATRLFSPTEKKVRIGFYGAVPPETVIVNGKEIPDPMDREEGVDELAEAKPRTKVFWDPEHRLAPDPVELKKGANTLVVKAMVTQKLKGLQKVLQTGPSWGTSIVLKDAATLQRDRSVIFRLD